MITGLGQPCNQGHRGDGSLQLGTGVHPSFFLSRHFVIFVSNDVLIFTGGAYDEGPNEPLHGLRAVGGSS